MAGTRRRSRISDTTAAIQPQRTASRAASSTVKDGDDAEQHAHVVEVAESVDNGSPRPRSPVNRATKGYCRRCDGGVGEFYNSWFKITGTYYLPALLGSYSSLLREHGKQKAASIGTDLDGCLIQPLSCPGCGDTLGFTAVDAPEGKQSFRGRDFFKLPRIELRCEISPTRTVAVEPQVDAAPAPLAVEDSDRSSPVAAAAAIPPPADMEVDARPPPPPPSGPHHPRHEQHHDHPHHHHHHHHHHHTPLQQVEANRQSLPPPPHRSPSGPPPLHSIPQKSPSNPPPQQQPQSPSPAVKPVHDVQFAAQPPPREASVGLANRTRDVPPLMSHSHSPAEQPRTNGQLYPKSPHDVQLDAIERLQTQISQNSGALIAHSRDMRRYEETLQHAESIRRDFQTQLNHQDAEVRRIDEAVGRLQHEMRGIRGLLEDLTREVHATRGELQTSRAMSAAPGPSVSAQDSALELMAQQVAVISQKANEVDTLKITIEIMKNKIQRLEDAPAAPAQTSAHPFPSPREQSAHSAHSSHTIPSYHTTPSAVPHINTPVHPAHKPTPFVPLGTQSVAATPEVSQRAEPAQSQSGWVTVNAGAKRTLPNGIDGPHESIGQPVGSGSPKRPKLAPIEPRIAYANSQSHPHQHVYDHMDTDDSDARIQTHSHTLPSQTPSRESIPESTLASQHQTYAIYATQDAPSEDSWRPESQRIVERTPRGRGRGGGPGSRGGRGRKSMAAQVHPIGTPEWEREDWQGVPDSQTSPDGFYNHVARSGRGIIRRGSGGGGSSRGGRPSTADRAVSLGLQGVTTNVGIGSPADPYAHTKKTRTKPIRNADGILIRKDGRPDMRSQSSAANLRKVHARKEEQKGSERGFTPTNLHQSATLSAETPSPTGYLPPGQDVTASVQKKHSAIMGKMFPGGIDEATKEHNYARKVFEEEQDHTAHPRNQHHHHHHHQQRLVDQSPLEIKREQIEVRRLATQSPNDGDVDMDRAEDQADDEGQTPSEQSDNSGRESQYHDATNQEEQTPPKENGVLPPQPTSESSQTLAAESTQAS